MIEILKEPWPWYIAGPLIGLTVPLLLILGNETFGISSSLRHICVACIPSNKPFFNYNWKDELWNLFFVGGITIGGFVAYAFFRDPNSIVISESLANYLAPFGIYPEDGLQPTSIFSWRGLMTLRGFILIVIGGFLIGFGSRCAGGCTSGHAIMGISDLQLPSLIATIFFMLGGFFMTHAVLPFILTL